MLQKTFVVTTQPARIRAMSARLPLTRRQLMGGGALLAGGWIAAQLVGHRPLADRSSPFLGSSARSTLHSAFEALLPDPTKASVCTEDVDAFLASGDPVMGQQLQLALHVLEHMGGMGFPFSQRFTRQSIDERRAVIHAWRTSRIQTKRQIGEAVRKVVLFTWFSRPESWADIGYSGPMVAQ